MSNALKGEKNPCYRHGGCGTKEFENSRAAQKRALKLNQSPELTETEQDHIRPLSKGGLHHPDNLQILDSKLNDLKKDKWPLSKEENEKYNGLRF